jgi:hypothetical protein
MPAPARQQPYSTQNLAINPVKGIVGHYSDVEIDAQHANLQAGGGEPAITLHAGAVPDAGADTPQGLEDAFSVLDDGLHYFKLVEPGGRVLLQSKGFASPREAGQAVAALRAQGPAGLGALADQIQRPHEVSENELGNALSLLMQAD